MRTKALRHLLANVRDREVDESFGLDEFYRIEEATSEERGTN